MSGRWDKDKEEEGDEIPEHVEDLELPDDTVINLKWCERCRLGIQVNDDNAHIWAFCYMCGDPLKWYDKNKEFPPD